MLTGVNLQTKKGNSAAMVLKFLKVIYVVITEDIVFLTSGQDTFRMPSRHKPSWFHTGFCYGFRLIELLL